MIMGSQERSRKKIHIWKKAILHFSLCFVMGFFTGITPTNKAWRSSSHVRMSLSSSYSPQPMELYHNLRSNHTTIRAEQSVANEPLMNPDRLVIIVTPMSTRNKPLRNVLLMRLSSTLQLVARPHLWVVVEPKSRDPEVSQILRKTGIMYRHLVSDEDFSDEDLEIDHQRNLALNHIEHHRLTGVVHFAGLSNVYDLTFFQEIRAIE